MKKLIVSALFVTTFSAGLFAKGNVEMPLIENESLKVSEFDQETLLVEEDDECITILVPICDGGVAVDYVYMRFCGSDPYTIADSFLQC